VFAQEGAPLADWPVKGLQFAEKVERGRPIRLAHANHGRTRLIVDNPAILRELRGAGITLRADRSAWRGLPAWAVVVLFAVGGLALGLLSGSTLVADALVRLVPKRVEKSWGQETIATILEAAPFCEEAEGKEALQALVKRLAAATEAPFPFEVRVSNAPIANAFAAPGGHIVIFRGLLAAASSAEEVAGVLAHEMAHEVQRHPTRGVVRALGIQAVMSFVSGNTGKGLGAATGALINLAHGRDDESEADRVGVQMLNKANIRADGLVNFFERMGGGTSAAKRKAEQQSSLLTYLSTHPSDASRIAAIRSMARGNGEAMTAEEWQALKAICGTDKAGGKDNPFAALFR
jgi:predicted Zn-dependent protease